MDEAGAVKDRQRQNVVSVHDDSGQQNEVSRLAQDCSVIRHWDYGDTTREENQMCQTGH